MDCKQTYEKALIGGKTMTKKNDPEISRETHLTKHMLTVHAELMSMVDMMDQNKIPRVAAVIGSRISIIEGMFRTLLKDKKYKKRFDIYFKEMNEAHKKRKKEMESKFKPGYMG